MLRTLRFYHSFFKFLSTPSARRATHHHGRGAGCCHYFYPRPPRGGRHILQAVRARMEQISIHALREEGDRHHQRIQDARLISIHALREEGDVYLSCLFHRPSLFLSTPSARRATCTVRSRVHTLRNFYPRPPRGGRHLLFFFFNRGVDISIHALREEGDHGSPKKYCGVWISIHALREEGDTGSRTALYFSE